MHGKELAMKNPFIPHLTDQLNRLIIGVQTPENRLIDAESYFQEFRNLIRSNGIATFTEHYLKLRTVDSSYFFTQGKLEEIVTLCRNHQIDEIIISEPLSTQQERNLGELLNATIIDRTQLILEIFERGAQSAEGKLQVELAMLTHRKSRVSGKGIHLSQQGGGIGTRGAGETQKEKELQHIQRLITRITKDVKQLQKVRETQRKRRLTHQVPHISIIGYTNAGKSTILNALTKSTVYAEDKLFATLDTTTRELFIDGTRKGTISDTVGFIQNLPHELIDAFKSTLSDLTNAHLLLQVIDISDKNWKHHIKVVNKIVEELNITTIPMLYVFNKSDLLTPAQVSASTDAEKSQQELINAQLEPYQPHVLVSALNKEGLGQLIAYLSSWEPSCTQHSCPS